MYETDIGIVFLGRNRSFADELCRRIGKKRILPLAVISNLQTLEATLKCLRPEVIVIDDSFSEITAAGLLRKVKCFDFYSVPIVVVLSERNDAKYVTGCMDCGADYYMLKPILAELFWERVLMLFDDRRDRAATGEIRGRREGGLSKEEIIGRETMELLYRVGCSPKLKGFVYLKEAVTAIAAGSCINVSGKGLYQAIGNKFHQSWSNIERSIGVAVKSVDIAAAKKYFNRFCDPIIFNNNTVTSLEFISLAAYAVADKVSKKTGRISK